MPMKLLVSRVGDLATVGGSVLVLTSFRLLPDSFSFCLRGLDTSKFFYSGNTHCGRVEFLRGSDVSRMARVGHSLSGIHTWWERKCIAGLLILFCGLQFTICFNLAPWTGYAPPPE